MGAEINSETKKNILLEKSLSDFFSKFENQDKINIFLEKFANFTSKNFLTKKIFYENIQKTNSLLRDIFGEDSSFFEISSELGVGPLKEFEFCKKKENKF